MSLPEYYYVDLSNSSKEEKYKVVHKFDCDNNTNDLSRYDVEDLYCFRSAWFGERHFGYYSRLSIDDAILSFRYPEKIVKLTPQEFLTESYQMKSKVKQYAKTAAAYPFKLGWRVTKHQANYWAIEPMWKIISKLLMSVRYVVATTVLASAGYGGYYTYANYDKLLDMIPSISVEWPEENTEGEV